MWHADQPSSTACQPGDPLQLADPIQGSGFELRVDLLRARSPAVAGTR